MSNAPSLTVSPPIQNGEVGSPLHVTITNNGDVSIKIATSIFTRHSTGIGCALGSGNNKVEVSPSAFTLKPHQSEVTTVRLTKGIPPGEYVVLYEGSATVKIKTHNGTGTGTVNGAVGSEVVSKGASACIPPAPKAVHLHSATVSYAPFIAVVAIAVVLLAAAFFIIRPRRRPRQSKHSRSREIHHNG